MSDDWQCDMLGMDGLGGYKSGWILMNVCYNIGKLRSFYVNVIVRPLIPFPYCYEARLHFCRVRPDSLNYATESDYTLQQAGKVGTGFQQRSRLNLL